MIGDISCMPSLGYYENYSNNNVSLLFIEWSMHNTNKAKTHFDVYELFY